MAAVTIELPGLLSRLLDLPPTVEVEAETLAGALGALTERFPGIAVHLFDEAGALRPHVLCLHNRTNTRWLPSMDVPVEPGDRVSILQAVSGG